MLYRITIKNDSKNQQDKKGLSKKNVALLEALKTAIKKKTKKNYSLRIDGHPIRLLAKLGYKPESVPSLARHCVFSRNTHVTLAFIEDAIKKHQDFKELFGSDSEDESSMVQCTTDTQSQEETSMEQCETDAQTQEETSVEQCETDSQPKPSLSPPTILPPPAQRCDSPPSKKSHISPTNSGSPIDLSDSLQGSVSPRSLSGSENDDEQCAPQMPSDYSEDDDEEADARSDKKKWDVKKIIAEEIGANGTKLYLLQWEDSWV